MKTQQKGFTLIELLIIIVIIGLLTTISIPSFSGKLVQARDAGRYRLVHDMGLAMLATKSANENDYPYNALIDGSTSTLLSDIQAILDEQGITIPLPNAGYEYWYFSSGNHFIISTCNETTQNTLIHSGTHQSANHIECTTNNKIPNPIPSGRFDGGINFQLIP